MEGNILIFIIQGYTSEQEMGSTVAVLGNISFKAIETCKEIFPYHFTINVEHFVF